jgi:Nif-specific regulatory protein
LLDASDIWLSSLEAVPPPAPDAEAEAWSPVALEEIEKHHILRTLNHTDWNKSQSAAILQIERSTLDRKIKLFGLKR